jgi:pSer/pThr/pTyr-binding forkhead associated (FHA) protein
MAAQLRLKVVSPDRSSRTVRVDRLEATLGARADNDVVLDDPRVSGRHAVLRLTGHGVQLADSSTNGSFVRGERVTTVMLVQGEVLTIPPYEVEVRWRLPPPTADGTLARLAAGPRRPIVLEPLQVRGGSVPRLQLGPETTLLGAGTDAQVRLTHPAVSGRHAELSIVGELLKVRDLDSTNGTYLNGARVWLAFARPGDAIAFGPDAWYLYRAG